MSEKQTSSAEGQVCGNQAKRPPRTLYMVKQLQYKTYVRLEDALRPIGITSAQFRIMMTLRDHAKRSSAELSRMFGVRPQTMIKQIAILEGHCLVARSVAPDNKRVLEVELTAAGVRVLDQATAKAEELDKSVFAALEPGEAEQFRAIMLKLLKSLDQTDHEAEEYELIPGQLHKPG